MIPLAGGMAEWFKAAVLKTVDREVRGFESLSLRQPISGSDLALGFVARSKRGDNHRAALRSRKTFVTTRNTSSVPQKFLNSSKRSPSGDTS